MMSSDLMRFLQACRAYKVPRFRWNRLALSERERGARRKPDWRRRVASLWMFHNRNSVCSRNAPGECLITEKFNFELDCRECFEHDLMTLLLVSRHWELFKAPCLRPFEFRPSTPARWLEHSELINYEMRQTATDPKVLCFPKINSIAGDERSEMIDELEISFLAGCYRVGRRGARAADDGDACCCRSHRGDG